MQTLTPFILVATLTVVIIFLLVRYTRKYYGVLENLNIPVIAPYFCCGSDPFGYRKIQHEVDIQRMHKYGSIYGVREINFLITTRNI